MYSSAPFNYTQETYLAHNKKYSDGIGDEVTSAELMEYVYFRINEYLMNNLDGEQLVSDFRSDFGGFYVNYFNLVNKSALKAVQTSG